jgi:probable HAF family extracellular repeat protein
VVAQFDQVRYTVVDLGIPGGAHWISPAGISRRGSLVAGTFDDGDGRTDLFVWNGSLRGGGLAPASVSGINSSGAVVGGKPAGTDWHGVRWDAFRVTDLGTLGGTASAAWSINDEGLIVGWAQRADGVQRAVLWGPQGIVDLGSLAPDGCSVAFGINAKGVAVGHTCTVAGGVRGARFRGPDQIDDLGSLGGTTVATAISDSGLIVGYSYLPRGVYHGFVYADGKMIDAGTLPGMDRSQLFAVNSEGIAVGASSNGGDPTAVIYAGGRMVDLATRVDSSPYEINSVNGIDEAGNIIGTGRLSGFWRAVLLRPK